MVRLGISKAVISQNIGNFDNEYLAEVAQNGFDRFRAILMFDYENIDVATVIRFYKEDSAIVGARLFAETRSVSENPLAAWRAIFENGWIASVRGPLNQIRASHFRRVLKEFPNLMIRIEHLGSFLYARDTKENLQTLIGLSDFPNVHLMWGGFYSNSNEEYPYRDTQVYLRRLLSVFGSERIMWSGDWNAKITVGDPEMCQKSIDLFTSRLLLPELTDDQIDDIMGASLLRFVGWQEIRN